MKTLIIFLAVLLSGCQSEDNNTTTVPVFKAPNCSDYTEYSTSIYGGVTTYLINVNECNTLAKVILDQDNFMVSASKVVDTAFEIEEIVTINYDVFGFTYTDITPGRYQPDGNGYTQAIQYNYVNGDNFVTITNLPTYDVRYVYEGSAEYERILGQALYDVVILQFEEAVKL